jgi:signal transduction histidine kinase
VAEERARIAREMHDVISHSLAVMVTLSDGAARVAAKDPVAAASAMERVSETGRDAVRDMRRLLGVLAPAPDEEALAPQPGGTDLVKLAETYRQAGLPVKLSLDTPLPADAVLQLTVYRIVQESLTNALRHGPSGTRAEVVVSAPAPDSVEVAVANSGGLAASDPSAAAVDQAPASLDSAGHGLVGMRQRVSLYGGTLEAGPTPEGGWRVRALLHPSVGRQGE